MSRPAAPALANLTQATAESLFPEQPVTIAELGAFENPLVDGKSPMLSEGDPA